MVSASGATKRRSPWKTSCDLGVDELDGELDEGLEFARHPRRGTARHEEEGAEPEKPDERAHQEAVEVHHPERALADADGKMLEVMPDVFGRRLPCSQPSDTHRSHRARYAR